MSSGSGFPYDRDTRECPKCSGAPCEVQADCKTCGGYGRIDAEPYDRDTPAEARETLYQSGDRLDAMLAELEHQVVCARRHEAKMRAALVESSGWSQAEDRDWIVGVVAEAEQMSKAALARLRQGCAIVARARSGQ